MILPSCHIKDVNFPQTNRKLYDECDFEVCLVSGIVWELEKFNNN